MAYLQAVVQKLTETYEALRADVGRYERISVQNLYKIRRALCVLRPANELARRE